MLVGPYIVGGGETIMSRQSVDVASIVMDRKSRHITRWSLACASCEWFFFFNVLLLFSWSCLVVSLHRTGQLLDRTRHTRHLHTTSAHGGEAFEMKKSMNRTDRFAFCCCCCRSFTLIFFFILVILFSYFAARSHYYNFSLSLAFIQKNVFFVPPYSSLLRCILFAYVSPLDCAHIHPINPDLHKPIHCIVVYMNTLGIGNGVRMVS